MSDLNKHFALALMYGMSASVSAGLDPQPSKRRPVALTDDQLQARKREIAEHNKAVEQRKQEKAARKVFRKRLRAITGGKP